MTIWTQDMVCSIQGAEELLHKSEELFQGTEREVVYIENGFQIHVKDLPFYFQVSCFTEIGWNVFLTSINGELEDDEATDRFYHELEDAVDTVNVAYFQDDEEEDTISYNFFKLKAITQEKLSHLEEVKEVKDTGKYVLKIVFNQLKEVPFELGYSKIFKRWYYELTNTDLKENLFKNNLLRNYLEEVDYMIGNFNRSM
jgi:hypothetical protein